ncbi:TPA: hypothetical protein KRL47_001357 [Clostridioides difficile]|nr:hypothetical protein [Clostridioides difficile]
MNKTIENNLNIELNNTIEHLIGIGFCEQKYYKPTVWKYAVWGLHILLILEEVRESIKQILMKRQFIKELKKIQRYKNIVKSI